ncbi:MAG: hypothetical protein WDW38_005653 [Sanguina aurantia]
MHLTTNRSPAECHQQPSSTNHTPSLQCTMLPTPNQHPHPRHASIALCEFLLLMLAQPHFTLTSSNTDPSKHTTKVTYSSSNTRSTHQHVGLSDTNRSRCVSMADLATMTCLPTNASQQPHNQTLQQQQQDWPQLCPDQMTVMSIGTVHAPHRQAAQAATFGLRVPMVYITESVQPECVFCEETDGNSGIQDRLHLLFESLGDLRQVVFGGYAGPLGRKLTGMLMKSPALNISGRWSEKPLEWHCAQHRQLLGVRSLLQRLGEHQLPLWLLIVDDDTYVRLTRLVPILAKLDPDKVYVFGDEYKRGKTGFAKINGGSGFLLSRGTLRALLLPAPIHHYRLDPDSRWVPLGAPVGTSPLDGHPTEAASLSSAAVASAAAAAKAAVAAAAGGEGLNASFPLSAAASIAATAAGADALQVQRAQPTVLDVCVQRMLGGSWCRWHSDWILTRCVEVAVGSVRQPMALNGFGQFGCKADLRVRGRDALTCHYVATLGAMRDMQAREECGVKPKNAWWQNRYAWTVG